MQVKAIDELNSVNLLSEILGGINNGPGFFLGSMNDQDLMLLRRLVNEQFLHTIQSAVPDQVSAYYSAGIEEYHRVYQDDHFDHGNVWHKGARVLGPASVELVTQMVFFQKLRACFGPILVSDEENFGWPGIYWRLVRPGQSDIGPVHADKWFWDLGHGEMPGEPGEFYRVKLWISLYSQAGKSGLRVVPHSHKKDDWRYHGEMRGGKQKPVLDEPEDELDLVSLPLDSGGFVLFHDKLLHGGMPNSGSQSRVSMELTLVLKTKH